MFTFRDYNQEGDKLHDKTKTKQRHRAVSLSLDWDKIVKQSRKSKSRKTVAPISVVYDRDTVEFCTGSSYTGKWNALGMACHGNYVYPHGCEYEGGFEDGMFHGEGVLTYPMGQKLEGVWKRGKLILYKFANSDGLEFLHPWNYCKMPDRRFTISVKEGLQPAGREVLTNQQPTRTIIDGCYDTVDGLYFPSTKSIITIRDPQEYTNLEEKEGSVAEKEDTEDNFWVNSITMVSPGRENWIMKHCRKGWDEPAGYRPDLYEDWVSGRRSELEELDRKYALLKQHTVDVLKRESPHAGSDSPSSESEDDPSLTYTGTGRKLTPNYSTQKRQSGLS